MVRRWFSLIAVLAVAVLVLAVDASQGRERRFGRRARNRSDAYVPYYAYTQEGVAVDTQTDGRRAFYYEPESQGLSARARPVLLEVRVPAGAEIWIDGGKTLQKGAVRQFISPPIEPGRKYTYKIEAKWMDNGNERSQTRTLVVHPGERRMVDLTRLAEEKE